METYFLDTNIFIQCNELKQLNWKEITDSDEITLVITQAVNKEINKHKTDISSRRSKKARKAYTTIKEMLDCFPELLKVQVGSTKLNLKLLTNSEIKIKKPPMLDINEVDDRIIIEALNYQDENPTEKVYLLTQDTSMLLNAKACSLKYKDIPDSWLLPPENNSDKKKIIALEKEVTFFKKMNPQINLDIISNGKKIEDQIRFPVSKPNQLTENEIDDFVLVAKNKFPKVTNFSKENYLKKSGILRRINNLSIASGFKHEYVPPTTEKINKYIEEYDKWIENIPDYFIKLPSLVEETSKKVKVKFLLSNDGNVFAENVNISFKLEGGFKFNFLYDDFLVQDETEQIMTSPPKPPEGKLVEKQIKPYYLTDFMSKFDKSSILPNLNLSNLNIHRPYNETKIDKHAFYYKPEKPISYTDVVTLECDEFRHKVEDKIFNFSIIIPIGAELLKGAIKVSLTAKNLPNPINKIIPIDVIFEERNIIEIANVAIKNSK